jgi:hypothetical protein
MALLLLYKVDEGVGTHPNAFYSVEEELFILMNMGKLLY